MAARPPVPPDVSLNLALAVVATSTGPVLLLDGDLTIIAASKSFCKGFDLDPSNVPGRAVFDLGAGEWSSPQLRAGLNATAHGGSAVEAYEMDLMGLRGGTRRVIISAQRLDYGVSEDIRVLLSAADVTDARAAETLKNNLLREKEILLQEIQHRVANSLQIIASVLLQSARTTQSKAIQGHLRDAHDRVMSVAAVQQQLSASQLGEVALRPYFTQLCGSIGASMIHDRKQLSLDVESDDANVPADVSISLGLIVTELVINALKHAFPGNRKGRIVVGYHTQGPNWTLVVGDDGVGMPRDPASLKPGLGTSIVDALAKQLDATIKTTDAHPGTTVSVRHSQLSVVSDREFAV